MCKPRIVYCTTCLESRCSNECNFWQRGESELPKVERIATPTFQTCSCTVLFKTSYSCLICGHEKNVESENFIRLSYFLQRVTESESKIDLLNLQPKSTKRSTMSFQVEENGRDF